MTQEKSNFFKEIRHRHPLRNYDYDGITGVWLRLPYKIHLLIGLLSLPIIYWALPNIPFRNAGVRYFFYDYRLHLMIAATIFCLSSALLSLLKRLQVQGSVRPLQQNEPQVHPNPLLSFKRRPAQVQPKGEGKRIPSNIPPKSAPSKPKKSQVIPKVKTEISKKSTKTDAKAQPNRSPKSEKAKAANNDNAAPKKKSSSVKSHSVAPQAKERRAKTAEKDAAQPKTEVALAKSERPSVAKSTSKAAVKTSSKPAAKKVRSKTKSTSKKRAKSSQKVAKKSAPQEQLKLDL